MLQGSSLTVTAILMCKSTAAINLSVLSVQRYFMFVCVYQTTVLYICLIMSVCTYEWVRGFESVCVCVRVCFGYVILVIIHILYRHRAKIIAYVYFWQKICFCPNHVKKVF